jgi:long-chain fatty acid transport protein
MNDARFTRLGLAAFLIAALAGTASAANGYFSYGVGMRARATGGASVAFPQDALAGAVNPAAAGFLGSRFDVGIDWLKPDRKAEIMGNAEGDAVDGKYDANGESNFFIPEMGYNKRHSDVLNIGVVIYRRGGMNTTYTTPIPVFGTTKAGLDLNQYFLAPYFSYRVHENHYVGFGLNIAWQFFKASGLEEFTAIDTLVSDGDTTYAGEWSISPTKVTNSGHESSVGLGLTVGWMGRLHPAVDAGLVYRSRTWMGRFKNYEGLFAEMGDFDLPPSLAGGIAVRPNPRMVLALDVERIWYSRIKSINNPLLPNLDEAKLGEAEGAGFGWDDVTVLKFGVAVDATDKVRLLGGYNYGGQPIPASETFFNMLMPGCVQNHLTLGATLKTCTSMEITLAYMHAFEGSVEGSGSIPGEFGGGESEISMSENSLGIGIGWSF